MSADSGDPGVTPAATTPVVEVTAATIETLVSTGGYTHPLFQRTDADRPLPGQGLLLLMGGLVEQSGILDHAIAMVEMGSVTFSKMAVAGTRLRVELRPGASRPTRTGTKVLQDWTWVALDADDDVLATAEVRMLVRPVPEEKQ